MRKKNLIKGFLSFCVLVLLLTVFLGIQYFNPGNPAGLQQPEPFEIIAHRGAHVMWEQGTYDVATGCEATHIYEPTHDKIENTIPSIAYAFDLGATMVEIDVRRTLDDKLMVIHEFDLACKTDGEGLVSEHTVEYLKTLDVGYGFTHDNGKTYPFRGKGVGLMPTLTEVLEAFPDKKFLIDHKEGDIQSADLLIKTFASLPKAQKEKLYYWGPLDMYTYIAQDIPEIQRIFPGREEIKQCIMPYILSAGVLGFDTSCEGLNIGMNRTYAAYMWSWPYGFLHKAQDNKNSVFLMVDSLEDVEYFKGLPVNGIVTDFIDVIAPHYTKDE